MSTDFMGIACLDCVYVLDNYPTEDTKIRAIKNWNQAGGFATNAAKTYSLLGGAARLHSCFGNDTNAIAVKDYLSIANLKLIDYADNDFPIPVSSILVNRNEGTRTVVSSAKDSDIEKLNTGIKVEGDVLFIDGFFIETACNAVKQAKQKGVLIVFDADKWRDDQYINLIPQVDFVIAGNEFRPPNCETHEDVVKFFIDCGVKQFAITNGAHDIFAYDNGVKTLLPVKQVSCVDSLGAGDVFHGAFCYYILKNNFIIALKKASLVASEFCTDYGFNTDDTAVFGA